MATRQSTFFDAFDFTDEEWPIVKQFTDGNILYLKTLRAQAAVQKIALTFDPEKPQIFQQQEAVLRGKIDVLTLLIGD